MSNPRRAFLLSLPALMASSALGSENHYLTSQVYDFAGLPVHHGPTNTSRPVLGGLSHEDCRVEIHESDLAPGNMPHPPHHHRHEEIFLIRQGTLEITINGKSSPAGPGSVAFIASNDEHGVRNAGDGHAQYFVLAIHQASSKES
jgi:quercetin dioxygenase-like cupin family protein